MPHDPEQLLALTTDIVVAAAHANPQIPIVQLIRDVHAALAATAEPAPTAAAPPREPAVSIRASVKPDHIVCLEDGAKLKMLKRYLRTKFDMSPDEYRARWGLPSDYPMVAPNYAVVRRELALKTGLGRKRAA